MRRTVLVALAILLGACGSHGIFRDRGFDYLRAQPHAPLVYPDGIAPLPAKELYPIDRIEQRRQLKPGEKPTSDIPKPPQLVSIDTTPQAGAVTGPRVLSEAQVTLTADGSGYPVVMLDTSYDWAWQAVGDAVKKVGAIKVVDLDRERAAYFVEVDGQRTSADEPFQLKLNYTANGIQVALQVDENAMATKERATSIMQALHDALLQ